MINNSRKPVNKNDWKTSWNAIELCHILFIQLVWKVDLVHSHIDFNLQTKSMCIVPSISENIIVLHFLHSFLILSTSLVKKRQVSYLIVWIAILSSVVTPLCTKLFSFFSWKLSQPVLNFKVVVMSFKISGHGFTHSGYTEIWLFYLVAIIGKM